MPETSTKKLSPVFFGSLAEVGFEQILLNHYSDARFIILTDETVSSHWSEFLVTQFGVLNNAEIIEIPAGEENKNLEICQSVWEALSEYEVTRNDVILNLGGGVISDLGGFIASTFKRGLRYVNIPTTLLAQIDASVGGKVGIDLGPFKNQVGLFSQPDYVFADPGFLSTLPQEQLISGYAEMLKHGLIADADHWRQLVSISDLVPEELGHLISASVEIKKKIVSEDFDEKGIRKLLNFGHTIGHAIEGCFLQNENPLLHGYAVGLGMIAEAYISKETGILQNAEFEEIVQVCRKYFLASPIQIPDVDDLIKIMKNDKKNQKGEFRFSLLEKIGKGVYDVPVKSELIRDSLEYLRS